MAGRKEYKIRMEGTLVTVTEEVYRTYYGMKRQVRTQREKDERHGLVSYNALDTEELQGEELVRDKDALTVEDEVTENILHEKLRKCLADLTDDEKNLIRALYFDGISERDYASRLGISQRGLNKRRNKLLLKLKKNILRK